MANPITYLQNVATELKKVTWPTFPVLVKYFLSVVIGIALAMAIITAFDAVFLGSLKLITTSTTTK